MTAIPIRVSVATMPLVDGSSATSHSIGATQAATSVLSKAHFIKSCLHRDDGFIDRLISCIKADSTAGDEEVHIFVKKFGGLFGLATLMKTWVSEQVAVFENFVVVHSSTTPSSLDSAGRGPQSPIVETPSVNVNGASRSLAQSPKHDFDISSSMSRDEELDGTFRPQGPMLQVKQKKPKKRLTPNNINETSLAGPQSVGVMTSTIADESRKTASSAEANANRSYGGDQNNNSQLRISVMSPVKSKYDEMGISVYIETVNVFSCFSNDPLDFLTAEDSSCIDRLARILSVLMLHLYVPLRDCVVILSRMLAIQYVEGSRVKIESSSSSAFCISLTSDDHLRYFISRIIAQSLPLVLNLGPLFIAEVLELEHVLCLPEDITMVLRSVHDDASGRIAFGEVSNLSSSLGRDGFIRVFQSDLDDRNQYKSPEESAVFNERERLYDEMSELYRKYQDTVSGDLDGSKIEEFWKLLYRAASKMVLGIRDCNISWFAELLLDMLLHYGTNAATTQPDKFQRASMNPSSGLLKDLDQKELNSALASASSTGGKAVSSNSQNLLSSTPGLGERASAWGARDALPGSSGAKRHLLEARMGPGGIGASNSFASAARTSQSGSFMPSNAQTSSAPSNNRSQAPTSVPKYSKPNHSSGAQYFNSSMDNPALLKQFFAGLERPANFFPGNEQFFYRFVLFCDSYRFIESFQVSITCAIESLSTSFIQLTSIDSFTTAVLKLKILGRFFGLLIYWPRWILTISTDSLQSGPLRTMIERMDANRNTAKAFLTALPLVDVMKKALHERRFCLTLPWIAEFLKIMLWDYSTLHASAKDSSITVPLSPRVSLSRQSSWTPGRGAGDASKSASSIPSDLAAVQFLMTLFLSERKTLSKETASTNRLFTLFLLEDFIRCAPQSLRTVDRRIITEFDVVDRESYSLIGDNIDDSNIAFSKKSFIELLVPPVFSSVLLLQKRRMSKLRSRSPSTSNISVSGPSSSLRREASGLGNFPDMTSPLNVSRSLFGTSPSINMFSQGMPPHVDSNDNVVRQLFRDEDKLPISPGLVRRLSNPGEEGGKLETAKEPSSRFEPPYNQLEEDGGMAMAFRSPNKLAKPHSFSASIAPSLGNASVGGMAQLRSPAFENRSKSVDNAKLVSRLETAFWRQQPHLHTLSRFVLEQLNQGIRAYTKDVAVTEAVRSAWVASDRVRKTVKQEAVVAASLKTASDLLSRSKSLLQMEIHSIRTDTINTASEYAEKTSKDFMRDALPNLMRLHPTDERVITLGLELMKVQVNHLLQQLNEHIVSYATRKLDEVYKSSLSSITRIIEAQVGKAPGVAAHSSTSISAPSSTPVAVENDSSIYNNFSLLKLSSTLPFFLTKKRENMSVSLQKLCSLFEFPDDFSLSVELLLSENVEFLVAAIDPKVLLDLSNLKNSIFYAIECLGSFILALVEFFGSNYRFPGPIVSNLLLSESHVPFGGQRYLSTLQANLHTICNSIIDYIHYIYHSSTTVRDFITVELMGFFANHTGPLMYLDGLLVADGARRAADGMCPTHLPTYMLARCVDLRLISLAGASRSILGAVKAQNLAYYRDWIGLIELPQVHRAVALRTLSLLITMRPGKCSPEDCQCIARTFVSVEVLQVDVPRWRAICEALGPETGAALRKALCEDASPDTSGATEADA